MNKIEMNRSLVDPFAIHNGKTRLKKLGKQLAALNNKIKAEELALYELLVADYEAFKSSTGSEMTYAEFEQLRLKGTE